MDDYLFVRIKGEFVKIVFTDILYIESRKNYIQIVTAKNKFLVKITLTKMESLLPNKDFLRIHRGYIAALKAITGFNHNSVHIQQKDLPLSSGYRKTLLSRFTTLEDNSAIKKLKPNKISAL